MLSSIRVRLKGRRFVMPQLGPRLMFKVRIIGLPATLTHSAEFWQAKIEVDLLGLTLKPSHCFYFEILVLLLLMSTTCPPQTLPERESCTLGRRRRYCYTWVIKYSFLIVDKLIFSKEPTKCSFVFRKNIRKK